MKKGLLFSLLTILSGILTTLSGQMYQPEQYRDTTKSFEERTDHLLSRLTLQEKIDLMCHQSPAIERLGIPAYNWWNECLHGVARSGKATVFPQAIGMAAMWDGDEMFQIANAISDEARAKYHAYINQGKRGIYQGLTFWTPNINIFRDPRWGRGMETYGEDPFLTGELAVPFVKGLQGDDPKYLKLVATAKHFAVHSGPESTRHSFDVWPSDQDMAETYLPHFKKVVKEAGVYSVMCAYQSIKGAPCCGSQFLENLLREKWGFKGYIVSDCDAIQDIYADYGHKKVGSREEAAAMAVQAGTDLNCGSTYPSLNKAVEKGLVTEAQIDVLVRRLLLARMKLGQFDLEQSVKYASIPYSVVDGKDHQALALDAARKSIVLLKNKNQLLPWTKNLKQLAVIGPNSDDVDDLLANYNGFPSNPVTPLEGLRAKLPKTKVVFAQGCALAAGLPYFVRMPSDVVYTDESMTSSGFKAEYFDNASFQGQAHCVRTDSIVDFAWNNQAPCQGLDPDVFSVRWTAVLVPTLDGEYALGGEGFTKFDLFVDDKRIAGWWDASIKHKEYETMHLEAGKKYRIRLDYVQEKTEGASMTLLWSCPKPNLKQEALDLAASSDAVVLCMGLSPLLEGEEMRVKVEGFSAGDRMDIQLPATQTDLIKEICALGKPTVLVLLNGSALAFNWEKEHVPAIVEAWYPGQAGGTAIADVLFGDYNPAGRLPITFYRSIDQLPAFDRYDMTGKTYRFFKGEPLYGFGYGLSFSQFEYKWLRFPEVLHTGENLDFSVQVKNTGKRSGDEVVQVYVSLPDSKFRVPVRALQGFKRIHLKAGERKTVSFSLKPSQIAAYDSLGVSQVAAGRVLVSVGGRQPDEEALEEGVVVSKTVEVKGVTYFVED